MFHMVEGSEAAGRRGGAAGAHAGLSARSLLCRAGWWAAAGASSGDGLSPRRCPAGGSRRQRRGADRSHLLRGGCSGLLRRCAQPPSTFCFFPSRALLRPRCSCSTCNNRSNRTYYPLAIILLCWSSLLFLPAAAAIRCALSCRPAYRKNDSRPCPSFTSAAPCTAPAAASWPAPPTARRRRPPGAPGTG